MEGNDLDQRVSDLEKAVEVQAAAQAGAHATQAAATAGMGMTFAAGAAGLVAGMLLGIRLANV
ncbi:MAG: hypothetical protein ABR583_01010 [Gaiellaceae bacterium]